MKLGLQTRFQLFYMSLILISVKKYMLMKDDERRSGVGGKAIKVHPLAHAKKQTTPVLFAWLDAMCSV